MTKASHGMPERSLGLFDLPTEGSGRFEPARLTQARTRLGVSKTDLAARVRVSAAAIGQYEAGVNSPRTEVLSRLAEVLNVRPGFFAVGRPLARIDTVNAHFRSLRSARVSDRLKALATATFIWELTFALERYVKLPEADLPSIAVGAKPTEAASILRQYWKLPDGPVKHLVATAESRGIVVAVRPLHEIDAVDAFSAVIVDRPIVITTPRRSENVFRHRFSIAHEIGHLLMHGDAEEHNASIEREADEFAAAFLTPAAAYQRLAKTNDPLADPTSAYSGETPSLLRKASELAEGAGAGVPVLAEALRLSPAQVRNLLGDADERPVLRLVEC